LGSVKSAVLKKRKVDVNITLNEFREAIGGNGGAGTSR
jgi:hypothetical protein